MGWFDGHCDTVLKLLDGRAFLKPEKGRHVSLPQMIQANVRAQVFACFVLESEHPGRAGERAGELLDTLEQMVASTEGELRIARTQEAVCQAFTDGPRAAILSMEGADPLGRHAEAIHAYFRRGVRSMIFAWEDNAFSGTAFGRNTSLTGEGRRLLGLCEELGVVVDVSHLSDRAFGEVADLAERPFIASHSNCRALCPSPRNLTDQQIRMLADRGGVLGINLSPSFLDPANLAATDPLWKASRVAGVTEAERRRLWRQALSIPRPSLDWAVKHVLHAMDVGGEDCVGLGSDFDGIRRTPQGVESVSDLRKLLPLLQTAGLTERQCRKLTHGNFLRVFGDGLPGATPISPQ